MNVQIGLETLLREKHREIAGQRIGLVASPSSVDAQLVSSVERLLAADIELVALFGPEHGLYGEAQAGEHVGSHLDPITNLPIHSLYGATRRPTAAMLDGLDTILFDIQDGGLRFYTYLSTLVHVMEGAAEHGKRVVVLDRPVFLNGIRIEGNILDPAYTSFVGIHPLPIRYGMTAGEVAGLINEQSAIDCDLTVVEMRGWRRDAWFDDTNQPFVPPSPNLPTMEALTAYVGTCLVEGSNLSEGRGTTKPFEYIGAPFIDGASLAKALNELELPGVRFREVCFVPTFSKYRGEVCRGVQLYVTHRDRFEAVETALHLLATAKRLHPEFAWAEAPPGEHPPIDLLAGSPEVRRHLDAAGSVTDLMESWKEESSAFADLRRQYLLYRHPTP